MPRLLALCCAVAFAAPAAAENASFDSLLNPVALTALPEAPQATLAAEAVAPEATLAVASDEGAPAERLDCQTTPVLCRQMQRIRIISETGCTGRACYTLWGQNRRALHAFNRDYDVLVPWRYAATPEIGLEAARTARSICAQSIRGDIDVITSLLVPMNETLARLRAVQRAARRENVVFCRMALE